MNQNTTYRVNEQKIIHETLEGETILINLETGNYYSMNETGSVAWELLIAHHSPEQITAAFASLYTIESDQVRSELPAFFEELSRQELILPSEEAPALIEPLSPTNKPYTTPSIQTYEDMQEMLLADPIHDVDAVGWPKLK